MTVAQRIHDRVEVRADAEPMHSDVIGGVGDDRQLSVGKCPSDTPREPDPPTPPAMITMRQFSFSGLSGWMVCDGSASPAALSVIAALLLQVLIEWVGFVAYGAVRSRVPETLTILVLGLIVASCVLGQRTAHARILTVAALIVSLLSILTSVTLAIIAPVTGQESLVIGWLDLLLIWSCRSWWSSAWPHCLAATAPQHTRSSPHQPSCRLLRPTLPLLPCRAVSWSRSGSPMRPPGWPGIRPAMRHSALPAAGWGTPAKPAGWQAIGDEDNPSRADRPGPESDPDLHLHAGIRSAQ